MEPPTTLRLRSVAGSARWYAHSVVLSTAALSLMVLLRPLMEHSIYFFFLAAVSVSALYGGLRPGLAATVLSTTVCDFFLEWRDRTASITRARTGTGSYRC
jgi:K+-sensing histidine kinase KdpD